MDWIIFGLVAAWLGIVSWFDIRKNEIPHSAWVTIPLIGACGFRTWLGGWSLVLLAILVAAVSERERISQLFGWEEIKRIFTWFPLLFLCVYFSIQVSPFAALSIIGFWVAWELKWWGGADAVSAITTCLVWPCEFFVLAFLAVHGIAAIVLTTRSLIKNRTVKFHRIPGLPLILISVLLVQILQIVNST